MADLRGFDVANVKPSPGTGPIPEGEYVAEIIESLVKPTRDGGGEFLQLEFRIVEGPFAGRRVWSRLNLVNRSAKAVEFGLAELSAVCRAVGVLKPIDSMELHGKPLRITVRLKKRADTKEDVNQITCYSPCVASSGRAAPDGSGGPPWAR